MHGLEAEYWGQVDFIYLDRDAPANESVMQQYRNRAQPQFVLIDADGNVIREWLGAPDIDELRAALDAAAGG